MREKINDRTQSDIGLLDGFVINLNKKCKAVKEFDLDTRNRRWVERGDARGLRFKKAFTPKHKLAIQSMKDAVELTIAHFTQKAGPKFGFPLKPFREQKYNHDEAIEKERDEDRVDYSADETDMRWLTIQNTKMFKEDTRVIFSVAILEHWFDRLEKLCMWKPKEHVRLRDDEGNEVDDVCNICLDPESANANQIVYCDRCNLPFHQECYGIPFIPEGSLICRRCVVSPSRLVHCVLCPSTKGCMKQMDNGLWVHVLCVIWIAETHFGNTIFMENVQSVEKAIQARKSLRCSICVDTKMARRGACIQCSEPKCTAAFHVTCARDRDLIMRIEQGDDGMVRHFVWCVKHQPDKTDEDIEHLKNRELNRERENAKQGVVSKKPQLSMEIINKILAECPFPRHQELIYYWAMKRADRMGAPLLKYLNNRLAVEASSGLTPQKLGRIPENWERMIDKVGGVERSLASGKELLGMMISREQQKRELVSTSLDMLQQGFPSPRQVIMAVIDQLKGIDEGNVFAEPVDIVGYRDIIEHPISLRDMIEKANSGGYASIADLAADVTQMVQNCYKFNKGNRIYINIGQKYQKKSQKILETARKMETDRQEFNGDKDFMARLLNGVLGQYTGPRGVSRPEIYCSGSAHSLRPLRGARQIKVEVIEDEEMAGPAPKALEAPPTQATPPVFKKPGRKRALLEEPEDATPPAPRTIRPRPPVVVDTPTTSRKRTQAPPTTREATPTLHQTKLTSFFGATPKQQWEQRAPRQAAHVHFADSPEKSARLLFNDIPSTSAQSSSSSTSSASSSSASSSSASTSSAFTGSSLFSPSSTSSNSNPFLLNSAPSSSNSRPATRSTSSLSSTNPTPTVTRASRFRASSSNIQSPLPTTTKVGKHAMEVDSDDDPDAEILIQAPGGSSSGIHRIQMTPEEIRREKLRSAENEARSKFAHNQLVLVDGKAAKVIEMPMAHMEMGRDERADIITRRREVLSEIPKSTPICVQFFHQKPNAAAPERQWVTSDRVELLDLNTVGNGQKSPKIPGLKAARDWHQQVLNGSK